MDALEFLASVISSLAWPVGAVILILVFRAEVRALLKRPIHRAKAGPVELEWEALKEYAVDEVTRINEATETLPIVELEAPAAGSNADTEVGGSGVVAVGISVERPADAALAAIKQANSPEELVNNLIATTLSAGSLVRGEASQRLGAITIRLQRPIPAGRTSVSIKIETPGVRFQGTPVLTAPSDLAATAKLEGDTITIELAGPTYGPTQLAVSGLRLAVDPDAPLGAIRTSVRIAGSGARLIASVGTVVGPR